MELSEILTPALVLLKVLIASCFLVVVSAVVRLFTMKTVVNQDKHFQILVLGDIGRSPRMQYHALSIVKHGGSVEFIGYNESPLHPQLQGHDRVMVTALPQLPGFLNVLPFLVLGPLKVIWQSLALFYLMFCVAQPCRWIIIQNPPSIPTLHTALVVSFLRRTHVMIDWHNYGWSILATTRGHANPFVKAYRTYESIFGRIVPTCSLAVTEAMARQLRGNSYSISSPVLTLHDRPAAIFQPITSPSQREKTLTRIDKTRDVASRIARGDLRLIVSSTSWTPDEDFGLLLDALVDYATGNDPKTSSPPVLAIITGKGPQKAMYEAKIAQLTQENKLPGVQIQTAWLSTDDYASLLACADLGICLHMSSSGVDLPMKVVDMFGAGLPVAAYSEYESFSELVKQGQNGCGFTTAKELNQVLGRLLGEGGKAELEGLKKGAIAEGSLRWDEEWDRVVGRIVGLIDP